VSAEIDPRSKPRLPRGVRLRHDDVRGGWTLLAPERIFNIDEIAATVLKLCDGKRDFETIVAELATRFNADRAVVAKDVNAMLGELAAKRVLEA
jgi:pyrroloquinoline quinone biosynthesis protein D